MYLQCVEQDKSVVSTDQREEIGFLEDEFQTCRWTYDRTETLSMLQIHGCVFFSANCHS